MGLVYTPEGRLLAAHRGDKSVTVWDTGASNVLARVELSDQLCACALSPDGRWLATATKNQAATIWEVGTARKVTELTNGPVLGMVFSRDSRWLAAVGSDQGISICETISGQLVSKLSLSGAPVCSLAFAPEAGLVAVSANDVSVLSLTNQELRQAIRSPSLNAGPKALGVLWMLIYTLGGQPSGSGEVFSTAPSGQVEFSPSGTHLAVINSAANLDTALAHGRDQVRIFELSRTQLVSTVAYNTRVSSIGFSPDGRLIATVGDAVDVWDWKNMGGTSGRPAPFAPVVVCLETHLATKSNSPLGRAIKPVHVGIFSDGCLRGALGERTAAFNVKMNDVLPSRPVAEVMREAVANLFARPAQPASEAPAALNIIGTVTKFSV